MASKGTTFLRSGPYKGYIRVKREPDGEKCEYTHLKVEDTNLDDTLRDARRFVDGELGKKNMKRQSSITSFFFSVVT